MFRSKKWWDEIKLKYKNENLKPLEIISLEEQEKEGKILDKETDLILYKQKYFKSTQ